MVSLPLFLGILGGIVPALLWLTYWLLEDRCEPEPKRYIFLSFLFGMIAVVLVLPVEQKIALYLQGPLLLLAWAAAEELFKFGAAYLGGLRAKVFDEPVDAVIYLITAALGFAALENTLFIFTALKDGTQTPMLVMVGDLRFMGATLLHVLASATIGVTMAFSFYRSPMVRRVAALVGVILAVSLHTLFNFFILEKGSGATFWVFFCIWAGIIGLLFLIERVKDPVRDRC